MSKFYTSVERYRNEILVRGYENGERVHFTELYSPYLFVEASRNEIGHFKNLDGKKFVKKHFDKMGDASAFTKKYADVSGFSVFGLTQYQYLYIYDNYPGEIEFDQSFISIGSLDIETKKGEGGYAKPESAEKPITLITVRKNGHSTTFGYKSYKIDKPNRTFIKCKDERDMLYKFLDFWKSPECDLDIITGWNVSAYDVTYIHNRLKRELGKNLADSLSPWGIVEDTDNVAANGFTTKEKHLVGIAILDYMALYKKFAHTPQESYSLEHISNYELETGKLNYSEYASLDELEEKDYQKFVDYNILDTELVDMLEEKLQFINQVLMMAYDSKCNFVDCIKTVRMWDMAIHSFLMDQGIVVPQRSFSVKEDSFEGGYVKDPAIGMHHWIVTVDFESLYPKIMIACNISPETYRGTIPGITQDNMFDGILNDPEIARQFRDNNYVICATGCVFDKNIIGFIPKLVERDFNKRKLAKTQMKELEKEKVQIEAELNSSKALLTLTDNELKEMVVRKNKFAIAKYNNLQMSIKIKINSLYGALANIYMRWFDLKLAESITKQGQVAIRWVIRDINKYLNKILGTVDKDYVIGADTDSAIFVLDGLVKKIFGDNLPSDEDIVEFINNVCKEKINKVIEQSIADFVEYTNGFQGKLRMERDIIANKGMWTSKKHYALNVFDKEGVRYDKPKLIIKGLESQRSSTPTAFRKAIKDAVWVIMNKNEEDFIEFVDNFREKNLGIDIPFDEYAFPRGINGLKKYGHSDTIYSKGTPAQVKGALFYNHLLKTRGLDSKYPEIHDGDKIKFVYLKEPNPISSKIISVPGRLVPSELELEAYIDKDLMMDKGFLGPIRSIAEAIGWKYEYISDLSEWIS